MIDFLAVAVLFILALDCLRRIRRRDPLLKHVFIAPTCFALYFWVAVNDDSPVSALFAVVMGGYHVRDCRRLARMRAEIADLLGEKQATRVLRSALIAAASGSIP